jgi:hypothetical protein
MLTILPADKALIRKFRQKIEGKFDQFKDRNNKMGLYFTSIDRPFITFAKGENDFPQEFRWRKNKIRYITQYDTSKAAGPQTDAILNMPER